MRTHRVARLVAILLFLAALVYFCGGMAIGLPLWSRGLGEGWGSGFSGWLAIPILAGTLFGAIVLLIFGAILYFLARIDTNLTTLRQNPPEPAGVSAVVAGEAALVVPPEAAPVPVEPIVVGAAAVATVGATHEEARAPAAETEAVASPEPDKAGLGATATAAVAGVVVAGVAVLAAHEDETTPAETEAASEAAVAAGPQVEIGPLETPEPEAELLSSELGAPAVATAGAVAAVATTQPERGAEVETPDVAAATEQAPQPSVESSEAVAEAPSLAADETETPAATAPAVAAPKAEADAPKLSGLDALLIGLGRLALGQQPAKPAEAQPPVPDTAASVAAIVATDETLAAPDLDAELPADADAAPQEFTGKLPGADEAARIASEMSGGDPDKRATTE